MSILTFNYGPCVKAFQPQPNDKNAGRVDEATHQIVQRHLPPTVKVRHDAAHTSGVALPAGDFIHGFRYVVETRLNGGSRIVQQFFWQCTFGMGCVTSSGFMLQPNIQEREFGRCAPSLEGLDPSAVRQFYIDLCRVAHDYGVYLPACEEIRPEETFSVIECGDAPTARVPKFCQSQAPQWEAIIHHHLKHNKVIPSSHPQANEIRHNPNGYEALMLLISPCHPAFTENGILIQPHPQQGRRTLDEHFRHCEFCCYTQRSHLSTRHDWADEIHVIRFLDSCPSAFERPSHSLQSRETCSSLSAQVHARAHCYYTERAHAQSVFCPAGWTSSCYSCHTELRHWHNFGCCTSIWCHPLSLWSTQWGRWHTAFRKHWLITS
mgnify:CR=1 FL=1